MTAEEYLKNTCNQNQSPRMCESSQIHNMFQDLANYILGGHFDEPIVVLDSYTTDVYPRFVYITNTNLIIWDNHFWDLYGRFLFMYFTYTNVNELPDSLFQTYFKSLIFLFLSNRFERIPSLARYIAEEYHKIQIKVPPYNIGDDINDILDKVGHLQELNIGRLFGFCHEIAHIAFRKNNKLSNVTRNNVISYCEALVELQELEIEVESITGKTSTDDNNTAFYEISKQLLDSNNSKLLEEICCDIIAMFTISTYLSDMNISEHDIGEIISTIHYFLLFTWWLSSSEQFWDTMQRVYSDISNDDALINPSSSYYRFGDRITAELSVRVNFSFSFFSQYANIPLQDSNIQNKLFSKEFITILQESVGYDVMERILRRYTTAHKDLKSSKDHINKKNALIGWYNKSL